VNSNLPPGDYLWRVKNPQTTANGGTATLAGGVNTIEIGTLREGDANNDNCITVSDFNITKPTYGRSPNDGGYDPRADYNGDNLVTISDFNLLKQNYGVCGEPPIPNATPTATPAVSLVGHITMQGRLAQPNPRQSVPVSVTLRITGGSTVGYSATTDQSGFFTITTGLTPGTYAWRVKHDQTLANAGNTVLVLGTNQVEMGLMLEGDANNDNCITTIDFNTVKVSFGKAQGDPGYDGRADFNGDNQVGAQDFNLQKPNFGSCGPGPLNIH
jgi:Dockerin type I domain